jgi:hypothetical protein
MIATDIKAVFLAMPSDRKGKVLSLFAHNLTVCARSANLPEVGDGPARRRFRAFNELLHTVTGQLMHMTLGDVNRYPDDVFIDILLEKAQAERCERDLVQAFEWSNSANLHGSTA